MAVITASREGAGQGIIVAYSDPTAVFDEPSVSVYSVSMPQPGEAINQLHQEDTPGGNFGERGGEFHGAPVQLEALSKSYGNVRAVRDVSLEVGAGEFLALLGPSGSGKTTLFMTMAGFEQPDSGRIVVGGREMNRVPPHKRGFGMVFQRWALFPHMSVGDNIAYPLKRRRVEAAERRRRVHEALEMVEMGGYEHRRTDQISGGQQQRVALARALVFRPRVLLMDEPLGSLDRKLREQVQIEIRRLHRELGTTVLYVTHDQDEAFVMAERVAVMQDGRLLQEGTPLKLYEEPANAFVAGFLGRTNFLEGELQRLDGNSAEVSVGSYSFLAAVPEGSPLASPSVGRGTKVKVAIRPEHINIDSPDGHASSGLQGVVADVIFVGATTTVTVDLGFGSVEALMVTTKDIKAIQRGNNVAVTWNRSIARVFPQDEGN